MREIERSLEAFPFLEIVNGVSGPRAHVRGGPDVWEVILVYRSYPEQDRTESVLAHFGGSFTAEMMRDALAYAERFPTEIAARLADNDRMERLLRDDPAIRSQDSDVE